jgi:hypothetical protein
MPIETLKTIAKAAISVCSGIDLALRLEATGVCRS